MSEKIELEYPYNERWKHGYIVTNTENRKNVILYNNNNDRSTTALARYRMAVELGRFLEEYEHVDHIDNDKTNDCIDNLQILSVRENIIKQTNFYGGSKWLELVCPVCNRTYIRKKGNTFTTPAKYGQLLTCGRSCSNSANHRFKNLTPQEKQDINYINLIRFFNVYK